MQQITWRSFLGVFSFICLISLAAFHWSDLAPSSLQPGYLNFNHNAGVLHLVMFEWKSDTNPDDIKDASRRMLALKDQCLHPVTEKPYVRSVVGGSNVSPESLQSGISQGFVVQFENDEDRRYYLEQDPVHHAFSSSVAGIIERVDRVDFVAGVFN